MVLAPFESIGSKHSTILTARMQSDSGLVSLSTERSMSVPKIQTRGTRPFHTKLLIRPALEADFDALLADYREDIQKMYEA